MRSFERLIELLETLNHFVAKERSVVFAFALKHLKAGTPPTVWQVEQLLDIAQTDRSDHFRGLAEDILHHLKERELIEIAEARR